MTSKLFSELGISAEIQKAIDRLGFEQASPIQAQAIPVLLQGKDIVGQSQTGSGKTAAFGIPAIEMIDPAKKHVQALILCPTRELAVQVSEEIHKLAFFKRGIHALPIYGGQSYERQFSGLRAGAHIVIGTPGRVMDHMRRGTMRLDQVKMVILDEADVMLDMGFREDIEFILQGVPAERQTVFFSATMPKQIQELIQKYSRNPESVKIEQKAATVPTVEQVYYEVDRRFKIEVLTRLIDIHDLKLGIIFCNTKRMVDDLVDHLNAQGYSADRLHGDMSQPQRDRVMNKFRKSGLEFLVATDVAARGIDVDDVQVVFNYDLPYDGEDYVHRIGRTGRAGRSGRAISFVSGREVYAIQQIERYTRTRIQRAKVPTITEVEQARNNAFLGKLRATLTSGEFKRQDHLIELLLEEGFTSTDIASAILHHLQTGDGASTQASQKPPVSDFRDEGFRQDRNDQPRDRYEKGRDRDQNSFQARPSRPSRPMEARPMEARPKAASPRSMEPRQPSSAFRAVEPKPVFRPVREPAKEPATPAPTLRAPVSEAQPPEPPRPVAKPEAEAPAKKIAIAPRVPKEEKPKIDKASRKTPDEQTRIYIGIGSEQGVTPPEILESIQGQTGLSGKAIGFIDIRERHSFVDVAAEHANSVISKLNRAKIGDKRVKVKLA
ncbi:MAG: DEAD/DEAH box helicase [Verrucomicrobiales bacterium]